MLEYFQKNFFENKNGNNSKTTGLLEKKKLSGNSLNFFQSCVKIS